MLRRLIGRLEELVPYSAATSYKEKVLREHRRSFSRASALVLGIATALSGCVTPPKTEPEVPSIADAASASARPRHRR